MAESHKRDERCRPSSQRPQYPTLYRRLKQNWGASKFQGPVSKPKSFGYNRQLNSSGLHKQTRRNSFNRDVRSPVEDHDLVPSLPDNLKSQTHSRVSECDGQPSVQVEPSAVNRMVTASTGVQTDLSKVVLPSYGSICHLSEPQTSTVRVSSPRPQCLGHRCSKHKLVRSHCLCLPSDGSPSQGILKIRQCNCLVIVIAPGWPGLPWFWDLVQLSTQIPLQLPVSTTPTIICFTAIHNMQRKFGGLPHYLCGKLVAYKSYS